MPKCAVSGENGASKRRFGHPPTPARKSKPSASRRRVCAVRAFNLDAAGSHGTAVGGFTADLSRFLHFRRSCALPGRSSDGRKKSRSKRYKACSDFSSEKSERPHAAAHPSPQKVTFRVVCPVANAPATVSAHCQPLVGCGGLNFSVKTPNNLFHRPFKRIPKVLPSGFLLYALAM